MSTDSNPANNPPPKNDDTNRRTIYPEIDPRLKNVLFWLGLVFVGVVFFFHNISGYS